MNFSSLEFLFFFFPIVIAGNFLLPKPARNYWLLAASLFFYAWGEPTFFLLLILSIVINYCLGLLLDYLNRISAVKSGMESKEERPLSFSRTACSRVMPM